MPRQRRSRLCRGVRITASFCVAPVVKSNLKKLARQSEMSLSQLVAECVLERFDLTEDVVGRVIVLAERKRA